MAPAESAADQGSTPQVDLEFVDRAVARFGRGPEAAIPLLHALQEEYRYLPAAALERICATTEIRPSTLAGIATFYGEFRLRPVGRHLVQVCLGTACHVKGAPLVFEAFQRALHIEGDRDTDDQLRFTLAKTACMGCCTLAPVVRIDGRTHGHLGAEEVPALLADTLALGTDADERPDGALSSPAHPIAEIRVGLGSCCVAGGSHAVYSELRRFLVREGIRVAVKRVGCVGMCHRTPLVEIARPGHAALTYARVAVEDVAPLLRRHFAPATAWARVRRTTRAALERLLTGETPRSDHFHEIAPADPAAAAFLGPQCLIATERRGELDPLDLAEHRRLGGHEALRQALTSLDPEEIVRVIGRSGLRGRGGAGFPTGRKWDAVRQAAGDEKWIVCNGDEGDPGAFMDRMILESYPYRVIEGMTIAARAVGARQGLLYIRAEYPLAVERVSEAIRQLEGVGLLGENLFGTGFSLRLHVVRGAGAFVCGEESALIASVEGARGHPRFRPPYPAERGLHGLPTLVNNVETYAVVPWILRHGPEAFATIGTGQSKGTKVFALAGKVARGGLIEVPMGATIRQIVEEIGGGVAGGRQFKAVQIGGPSGGCIPAALADTPVDYERLAELGAMMGSGGLVVLDDTDCIVDMARYFLSFTQNQSCGKCAPCRVGTRRMLDLLDRICEGRGRAEDLDHLQEMAEVTRRQSLCGLGRTAPNPVLSTLRHFRDEYEAHLAGRCPAGRCRSLIRYEIGASCIGCTLCAQHCPTDAIPAAPLRRHAIDAAACIRCDLCRQRCPVDAIRIVPGARKL